MAGRVFLILILGIVLSAALTLWLASGERQRAIAQIRDFHAVDRAEQLILALDAIPAQGRQAYLAIADPRGLRVEAVQADEAREKRDTAFTRALRENLGAAYKVAGLGRKPAGCGKPPVKPWFGGAPWRPGCESMNVTLRDGETVRLSIMPPRDQALPSHFDFLSYLGLFLASIALLAYLVARMTTRPLKQLAQAANDLGRDINHPPLVQKGSSEIRQASAAFNAMQARIAEHIAQRTQMLAAITHDLQTPLTRLRLRLEKVPDLELRDKLVGDLSSMQEMVREGLDLARSMDSSEPMQPLDLDSLLDSVCADAADAGQEVTLQGQTSMSLMARPMALQRCLINLIDNAVKYGRYAHVQVERMGTNAARIHVRDGGLGIAPDLLLKVFEPFYRLESSRSRDSGGTGLGLTIARNIAEQHGGSLSLANHREGGLEVSLILPAKAGSGR